LRGKRGGGEEREGEGGEKGREKEGGREGGDGEGSLVGVSELVLECTNAV
jgi:hypothetical protein